ncbi:MAG: hypothetical protein NC421_01845 [Lachnospiraceae bacterium]|nr:hypothetical protein [Lachnospiraceae bacterium]
MNKIIKVLFPLMFIVSAAGCSDDSPVAPGGDSDDGGKVNFSINVCAGANGSRAFYDLQDAEEIYSLRVILVRPNGIIEANEYITAENGVSVFGGVRLKVLGGEEKKVYLIANESSVTGLDLSAEEYGKGKEFPTEKITGFELSAPGAGKAVIDNTGDEKRAIPMAEVFDINVKAPVNEEDYNQSANLFLVRALTKFSFTISSDLTPVADFAIDEIRISKVGQSMYLFPNETVYSPAKYPVSFEMRDITDYKVPLTDNSPITFKPDGALTLSSSYIPGTEIAYSPELYFAETKLEPGEVYTVSVKLAGASEFYKTDIPLDNLPSLPRNTHVQIKFKVENTEILSEAVSIPYVE